MCIRDQRHDVSIADTETIGRCWRDGESVAPCQPADWIGQFLQPGVVGVTTVAECNGLVHVKLVLIGAARGSMGILANAVHRRVEITDELRNGLSRYRHAQETGLNAAVPECIEVALRALERKEIPLPVRAQFMA